MKKKKKQPRRTGALWLVRDDVKNSFYEAWTLKPTLENGAWNIRGGGEELVELCPDEFEKSQPKKFHLKRGGGPLKIKLQLG